jgi:hypothetical protein
VAAWAQEVQPVPALSGRVIDTTGTLDAVQKAALDARLAALEAKKGAQVVVLMVPTHGAGRHCVVCQPCGQHLEDRAARCGRRRAADRGQE